MILEGRSDPPLCHHESATAVSDRGGSATWRVMARRWGGRGEAMAFEATRTPSWYWGRGRRGWGAARVEAMKCGGGEGGGVKSGGEVAAREVVRAVDLPRGLTNSPLAHAP